MLLRAFLSQLDIARYKWVMMDKSNELCLQTYNVMDLVKDNARHPERMCAS